MAKGTSIPTVPLLIAQDDVAGYCDPETGLCVWPGASGVTPEDVDDISVGSHLTANDPSSSVNEEERAVSNESDKGEKLSANHNEGSK